MKLGLWFLIILVAATSLEARQARAEDPTQQRGAQDQTKDLNDQGAEESTGLGTAAIGAGMAMVAAGAALLSNPQTAPAGMAMMAAGMAMVASGMAALDAADKMNQNANQAGLNGANMEALNEPYRSTISTDAGSSTDAGGSGVGSGSSAGTPTGVPSSPSGTDVAAGETGGIQIDPALTRSGKLDAIFNDMEKKTGLSRDDVVRALNSNVSPVSLLANSPAIKGAGVSEGNLQSLMDDTKAKGLPSDQDVMAKLGLSQGDVAINGGRGPASGPGGAGTGGMANIDALFPDKPALPTAAAPAGPGKDLKLSPELQAALDRNSPGNRSLFEMVHSQYRKKTPLMYGVDARREGLPVGPADL